MLFLTLLFLLVCSPSIYYLVSTGIIETTSDNLLLVLISVREKEESAFSYIKSSVFHFWQRKMEMGNRKEKWEGEGTRRKEEGEKIQSSILWFSDSSDWFYRWQKMRQSYLTNVFSSSFCNVFQTLSNIAVLITHSDLCSYGIFFVRYVTLA